MARAVGLGVLLLAGSGGTLANAALVPPAGYFAAVRIKHGEGSALRGAAHSLHRGARLSQQICGLRKIPRRGQSGVRRTIQAQYPAITQMEKGFSTLVTKYMQSGDPAGLSCAIRWLTTWADARALEGKAANHTGKSLRKWSLASLSSAYLRLKFSSSAPLKNYPKEATRIEAWFGEVAGQVKHEWAADDPLAKINNHYYWAAWAMMATAVATDRKDLFDQAVAIYHVFATQVAADGYLPNELARASRAGRIP